MYPPPYQQQPPVHHYGNPMGAPPVPASATVLLVCGWLKVVSAVLLMGLGLVFLAGASVFMSEASHARANGSSDLVGGLGGLLAGSVAAIFFCVGVPSLLYAIFDVIAGSKARKGQNTGRIMGMISGAMGGLVGLGTLAINIMAVANSSNESPGAPGSIFGAAIIVAINAYIFISLFNARASFPN